MNNNHLHIHGLSLTEQKSSKQLISNMNHELKHINTLFYKIQDTHNYSSIRSKKIKIKNH